MKKEIKKDLQIKKFCLYGFLKNLKFFEPYLLIYLMSNNLNLFQIGVLIAIREVIVNLFEIPSGFIADYFGRKIELYFCFSFYIISFIFFIFTSSFTIAIFAMIFFGLGEAFRSGTHKAMIYTYLDYKNWSKEKTFVYGRTRSFSLVGSAVSAVLGIILIIFAPHDKFIFLFSIIPYVLELLLILSYPKFLDKADKKKNATLKTMFKGLITEFKTNNKLRATLIEEGIAEGAFAYIKDIIQPLLEAIVLGSGILLISSLNAQDNLKVTLGFVYAIMNLCGSYFSRNTYKFKGKKSNQKCLLFLHISMIVLFAILAIFIESYFIIIAVYLLLFILHSVRKPIFIDEIDNQIDKINRATILSVSAQIKSLFLIIFAPILGFIANGFGINLVMIILSVLFAITLPLFISKKSKQ